MRNALRAGALYFLAVFLVGFCLGIIRALLLAPKLGDTAAVLIELPFILTAAWFACRFLIRKFGVARKVAKRTVMGACALALLLATEVLLGFYGFGRDLEQQLAQYGAPAGALGLGAQMLFASFPVLQLDRGGPSL